MRFLVMFVLVAPAWSARIQEVNEMTAGQGEKCSKECVFESVITEIRKETCCQEGLVCDQKTHTCELAPLSSCKKSEKCGQTLGRKFQCGGEDSEGNSHCCIPSIPTFLGKVLDTKSKKYEPVYYEPLTCCSQRAYPMDPSDPFSKEVCSKRSQKLDEEHYADLLDAEEANEEGEAPGPGGRGEKCSRKCAKMSLTKQQREGSCCQEGLVCDQKTRTCELALGSICEKKTFGKSEKCGKTEGRKIKCGPADSEGISRCCIPDIPTGLFGGIKYTTLESGRYEPLGSHSSCCSQRTAKIEATRPFHPRSWVTACSSK